MSRKHQIVDTIAAFFLMVGIMVVIVALAGFFTTASGQDILHCDGFECSSTPGPVLTVTPTEASPGEEVTLRWGVPPDGDCRVTGPLLTINNETLRSQSSTTDLVLASSTYALTCTDNATVTVGADTRPLENCQDADPSVALVPRPPPRWEDLFGPIGTPQAQQPITLQQYEYLNLRFLLPEGVQRAELRWIGTAPSGTHRIGVQSCLGAPTAARALITGACFGHIGAPGSLIVGTTPFGSVCQVEPGREYVLSLAFLKPNDTYSCDGLSCIWYVEER